jgi:hypothetical protein
MLVTMATAMGTNHSNDANALISDMTHPPVFFLPSLADASFMPYDRAILAASVTHFSCFMNIKERSNEV